MTRNRRVDGAVRAALVVVALMLMACPAFAQLRLDVTRGKVEPMPIAIPAFAGGGGEEAQTARDMAQVISADLDRSGLFRPLDPRGFIQTVAAGEGPRFGDWRQVSAQALVTGRASLRSVGAGAGLSENAVGPRLARTPMLAPYALQRVQPFDEGQHLGSGARRIRHAGRRIGAARE